MQGGSGSLQASECIGQFHAKDSVDSWKYFDRENLCFFKMQVRNRIEVTVELSQEKISAKVFFILRKEILNEK